MSLILGFIGGAVEAGSDDAAGAQRTADPLYRLAVEMAQEDMARGPEQDREQSSDFGRIGPLTPERNHDTMPVQSHYEPDIWIPLGVGAKAKDIMVLLPNGEEVPLTPGTSLTRVEVIAGKGRTRQIDEIDGLLSRYPGSSEYDWQKKKGIGYIEYHGESYRAEIHYYEEPTVGRVRFKLKPDAGGGWFIEG